LAELAGIHRTYLSDVERGARNPILVVIERFAKALKLSVAELFSRVSQ
jgi:transcriptional regulator with XRE-family HTH domain